MITSLENRLSSLTNQAESEVDVKKQLSIYEEMASLQREIDELYERWQYLLDASK